MANPPGERTGSSETESSRQRKLSNTLGLAGRVNSAGQAAIDSAYVYSGAKDAQKSARAALASGKAQQYMRPEPATFGRASKILGPLGVGISVGSELANYRANVAAGMPKDEARIRSTGRFVLGTGAGLLGGAVGLAAAPVAPIAAPVLGGAGAWLGEKAGDKIADGVPIAKGLLGKMQDYRTWARMRGVYYSARP